MSRFSIGRIEPILREKLQRQIRRRWKFPTDPFSRRLEGIIHVIEQVSQKSKWAPEQIFTLNVPNIDIRVGYQRGSTQKIIKITLMTSFSSGLPLLCNRRSRGVITFKTDAINSIGS